MAPSLGTIYSRTPEYSTPSDVFRAVLSHLAASEIGGVAHFKNGSLDPNPWIRFYDIRGEKRLVLEFRCVKDNAYTPSRQMGVQLAPEFHFDTYRMDKLAEVWECNQPLDRQLVEHLIPSLDQIFRQAFHYPNDYQVSGWTFTYFPWDENYHKELTSEVHEGLKIPASRLARMSYSDLCTLVPLPHVVNIDSIREFPGHEKIDLTPIPGYGFYENTVEVYTCNEPGKPNKQGFANSLNKNEIMLVYDRIIQLTVDYFLCQQGSTHILMGPSNSTAFLFPLGRLKINTQLTPGNVLEAIKHGLPETYRLLSAQLYPSPDRPGYISHFRRYVCCWDDFTDPLATGRVIMDDEFNVTPLDVI
jgi:hypothetical protein